MTDIILIIVVALILGASIGYIIMAKKRGDKCIGCSCASGACSDKEGQCGCKKD